MEKFKIHKNVRAKPMIIGLAVIPFFLAFGMTLVSLLTLFSGFTLFKLFLILIVGAISYFVAYFFSHRSDLVDELFDGKLPTYIENLPVNESEHTNI